MRKHLTLDNGRLVMREWDRLPSHITAERLERAAQIRERKRAIRSKLAELGAPISPVFVVNACRLAETLDLRIQGRELHARVDQLLRDRSRVDRLMRAWKELHSAFGGLCGVELASISDGMKSRGFPGWIPVMNAMVDTIRDLSDTEDNLRQSLERPNQRPKNPETDHLLILGAYLVSGGARRK